MGEDRCGDGRLMEGDGGGVDDGGNGDGGRVGNEGEPWRIMARDGQSVASEGRSVIGSKMCG